MEKKKEIKREQQERYIEGLKRYSQRGIPIYIDGKECRAEDCERLFEVSEDGAFYMGDYVGADEGQLREIRFDKVYLCGPPDAETTESWEERLKEDDDPGFWERQYEEEDEPGAWERPCGEEDAPGMSGSVNPAGVEFHCPG